MLRHLRQSLKWLVHHSLGKPVLINQHPVRVPRALIGAFAVLHPNGYEPEVCALLDTWLRPGDAFIDVGANIGVLSLHAARRVGSGGLVVSCEPNPINANNLFELFRANGMLDRLWLLPLAIGPADTKIDLFVSTLGSPTMGRTSVMHRDPGSTTVRVGAVQLDRFLAALPAVRMVKIDVEGAELGVLQGARVVLAKFQPVISLEMHGLYFDRPADLVEPVFELLENLGYGIWNMHTGQRQTAAEFLQDSGCEGDDPLSGRPFRKIGYGQLLAAPLAQTAEAEASLRKIS